MQNVDGGGYIIWEIYQIRSSSCLFNHSCFELLHPSSSLLPLVIAFRQNNYKIQLIFYIVQVTWYRSLFSSGESLNFLLLRIHFIFDYHIKMLTILPPSFEEAGLKFLSVLEMILLYPCYYISIANNYIHNLLLGNI